MIPLIVFLWLRGAMRGGLSVVAGSLRWLMKWPRSILRLQPVPVCCLTRSAAYISGLEWITQMRGTWPGLVDAGADLAEDANWPVVPTGAADLVVAF